MTGKSFSQRSLSLFLIGMALIQPGCATIISGESQRVTINSNPVGADVLIDEALQGVTPMSVELSRKQRHAIVISKNGQKITRATTRGFNWWYMGNLLFGGIVGLIVDPITGAMYKVKPESIQADFEDSPAPAVSPSASPSPESTPEASADPKQDAAA